MLGSVDQDHLFSILEALHEGNASALLQVASTLAVRSLSFSSALQELAALLTRIQVAQCVPEAVDEEDPDRERIAMLARMLSPEFVQLAYQIVNLGRAELGLAPDEHAGFLMTLLRLHTFRPRSVPEMLDSVRVASRPAPVAVPPAPVAQPPVQAVPRPAPAAEAAPVSAGSGSDDWSAIVSRLPLSGLAKELALNCELRALDDGRCLLRLPSTKGHLQMKPSPERLQQALCEHLGRAVVLKIEVGDPSSETPAETAGRQRQARQEQAEEAIEQDMFIQEAKSSLDASIVKSSIKPID
jgi:DNA polymerase-3 subunit gamma/tau